MKRRKHSGNKDLALSYRIDELPRALPRRMVLNRMIDFIRHGEELPEDWQITLRWRNSKKQPWREEEFQSSVDASEGRGAFNKLVMGRLQRDLQSIGGGATSGATTSKARRRTSKRRTTKVPRRVSKRRKNSGDKRKTRNATRSGGPKNRRRPRK